MRRRIFEEVLICGIWIVIGRAININVYKRKAVEGSASNFLRIPTL